MKTFIVGLSSIMVILILFMIWAMTEDYKAFQVCKYKGYDSGKVGLSFTQKWYTCSTKDIYLVTDEGLVLEEDNDSE